jgi:hypothetical protein
VVVVVFSSIKKKKKKQAMEGEEEEKSRVPRNYWRFTVISKYVPELLRKLEREGRIKPTIRRVVKSTGTLFLVISDSYNTPKIRNTNGIPTSKGSGTVKQKTGMHEFGTSGVNKNCS